MDDLALPSNALLSHGTPRLVYALSLIENLSAYLLGMEKRAKWIVREGEGRGGEVKRQSAKCKSQSEEGEAGGAGVSAGICGFWRERWMKGRVGNEEAMGRVAGQTLVYPVTHGGRVVLPRVVTEQGEMF